MPARHPYRRGDVVLVSLPFSNQAGAKNRPAVVLSRDSYHEEWDEVVLVAVTSQAPKSKNRASDCFLLDWQIAGLNQPSWVRSHTVTVDRRKIIALVGTLTTSDLAAVEGCLRSALGL